MLISLEWLNEFVDMKGIAPEAIAEALTVSGLEVETVERVAPKFTNIITAKIKEIRQHPNADKLHLVDIDNGNGVKTVVCGAQNIEVGQIIPYASVGSKVFSRKTGEIFELTPATIRGVVSEGMLCSQDELGLEGMQEEDGILLLNRIYGDDVKLGEPLENLLNLKEDTVFDVAPTANRGDEMSVIGVARELASIFSKELKLPAVNEKDSVKADFTVEIRDLDVCPYYSAAILENIKIKPSPDWMRRRLEVSGIRAINNAVDITNYVLLEFGQPLHAFDKDKINGYLCVRRAENGEKLTTLDEVERTCTTDTVLISTKEGAVCAGGVFGGINSGIDENSKNVVLEGAYFTPSFNRKSARSIGYRSEASARYERGVDLEKVKTALFRAVELFEKYADAEFKGFVQTGSDKLPEKTIDLRFSQIKKVTGTEVPREKTVDILEKAGFKLVSENDEIATFTVPGFRRNDVFAEIDLIEEIIRIYGYDKIPVTLPKRTLSPVVTFAEKVKKHVYEVFTGCGFFEAMTSSIIGEPLLKQFSLDYDKNLAVKVKNPQSEEHTMLRQTLVANLLACLKNNWDNGQKSLRLFEIGKTYYAKNPATRENSGVEEIVRLSGIMTGEVNSSLWKKFPETDFYTMKGVLDNLFDFLGLKNRVKLNRCEDVSFLHPGKSASVVLLGKGTPTIGVFGQVHPILTEKMKINQPVFIFELDLDAVISAISQSTTKIKKLPQFPEIQRDLAFMTEESVPFEKINAVIKKSINSKLYKSSDIFDLYKGEHVEKGFKSVAFRIKMQDVEATLTDEIIDEQMKKVEEGLKKAFPTVKFR